MNKIIESIWILSSALSLVYFLDKLDNLIDIIALLILAITWGSWVNNKTRERGEA